MYTILVYVLEFAYCGLQEKGDTALLSDLEEQQEKTAKQISRITGTGMRREGLFGGGMAYEVSFRPCVTSKTTQVHAFC